MYCAYCFHTAIQLQNKCNIITDAFLKKSVGEHATKLFHNSLLDSCVIKVAQHKVAFTGCLPITAVVIIPVHSLCWRISAP